MTFTTRTKITALFVFLVVGIIFILNWIIIESANQSWENRKMAYMKQSMEAEYTIEGAKKIFENLQIKKWDTIILAQGLFADAAMVKDLRTFIYDDKTIFHGPWKSFFILDKKWKDGEIMTTAEDITDIVMTRNDLIHKGFYYSIGAVIFVVIIGFLFSGYILNPIRQMHAVAASFSLQKKQDYHLNIIGNPQDDIVMLGNALDRLFNRIHEEADKLKQFSDDIAHEIKNKLFEIRSSLQVASNLEHQWRALEKAISAIDVLSRLVDALLFLSVEESYVLKEVDLSDVMKNHIDSLDDTRITYEGGNPIFAKVEMDLFLTAIQNIIGNAQKFTPSNGKITVRLLKNSLEIEDTGMGIDVDDLPHIFERFYKADTARTAGSGHGLGLAITKKILDFHGMKLEVESSLKKGTRFVVRLSA